MKLLKHDTLYDRSAHDSCNKANHSASIRLLATSRGWQPCVTKRAVVEAIDEKF